MSAPITNHSSLPVLYPQGSDEEMLDELERATFDYFRNEINPRNGLIADKTQQGSPSSIAVMGMGLSVYVVAAERDLMPRAEAVSRTLTILRFFDSCPQGPEPDATGYKGFYYHFLDMETGRRAWQSELSTVDTAIFMAGVLTAASYFSEQNAEESELREIAERLYLRVDWKWALNGKTSISHGWRPESGFLRHRWNSGYSEAHILYVLAAASPTFPIDPECYRHWTSSFEWKKVYDREYWYAGPLFIHQMSHCWLDFRGIQDDLNRKMGIDYFENSRRATFIHREYAIDNPKRCSHYHKFGWGLTASDGPGPAVRKVDGVRRVFYDYVARGAPYGPDDGTISPWAVVASLPFAPEIVLETIRHAIERLGMKGHTRYGFDASFNLTFPDTSQHPLGWVSPWIFGLNEGPVILMIENFRTELIWRTMRKCGHVINGLRLLGFRDGWLAEESR